MSNTFTKQITNKFGVSHVSDIIIGVEDAAAVTRTDTNPCLQEIYNLMEDFFFLSHLCGQKFHRNVLYVISLRKVSPPFYVFIYVQRTYPMASDSTTELERILFLMGGAAIICISKFALWKSTPQHKAEILLYSWAIFCP